MQPFAAAIASAILLIILTAYEDLRGRSFALLLAWFVLAVYLQFLAATAVLRTVGLGLQILLAIYLVLHMKFHR